MISSDRKKLIVKVFFFLAVIGAGLLWSSQDRDAHKIKRDLQTRIAEQRSLGGPINLSSLNETDWDFICPGDYAFSGLDVTHGELIAAMHLGDRDYKFSGFSIADELFSDWPEGNLYGLVFVSTSQKVLVSLILDDVRRVSGSECIPAQDAELFIDENKVLSLRTGKPAGAARIFASVEGEYLDALPSDIEKTVRAFVSEHSPSELDCEYAGRKVTLQGKPPRPAYFVTVTASCMGNSSSSVWLADVSGASPKIILSGGAMTLETGTDIHNGLNDLKLAGGNAGHAVVSYWVFDGTRYNQDKERSWVFYPDCQEEADNPDNPFDCQ